jgi:hypothetical protein
MKSSTLRAPGALVVLITLLLTAPACVKIEKGTPAEATETSEMRASNARSDWANRILDATPVGVVELLVQHVEGVTRSYVDFGHEIADEWESGERGRGEPLPAAEIRRLITAWTEPEQPILKANDDNLEFAYMTARESAYFDASTLEALSRLVGGYYGVYDAVFLPSGTREEYVDRLWAAEREVDRAADEVREELRRY